MERSSPTSPKAALIAALGNPLCGDDGFGAIVLERLRREPEATRAADLLDGANRILRVREIDLEVVFGTHLPRTVLREGVARAGDHAPARGREPLDGGVADAPARTREQHDAPAFVG